MSRLLRDGFQNRTGERELTAREIAAEILKLPDAVLDSGAFVIGQVNGVRVHAPVESVTVLQYRPGGFLSFQEMELIAARRARKDGSE